MSWRRLIKLSPESPSLFFNELHILRCWFFPMLKLMSPFTGFVLMVITAVSLKQELAELQPPALKSLYHFQGFCSCSQRLCLCRRPGPSLLDCTLHMKTQKRCWVTVPGDSLCTDGYRGYQPFMSLTPWYGHLWGVTCTVSRAPHIKPQWPPLCYHTLGWWSPLFLVPLPHFPTHPSWERFLINQLPTNLCLRGCL